MVPTVQLCAMVEFIPFANRGATLRKRIKTGTLQLLEQKYIKKLN